MDETATAFEQQGAAPREIAGSLPRPHCAEEVVANFQGVAQATETVGGASCKC
ncbi:hypothetical protein [Belnapia moabensis]|uniref:hypothetical protein n=1 Tax=Belnapia moabensis TaxID=365533 RepID=UPI0012ED3380|nr:hypothetical protein [Belnapia moabensis]